MPWVNSEMCTGCGVCVDNCVAGAVSIDEDVAFIDDDSCIRCGVCHGVCPSEAVRHDGERVPAEVEANLLWAGKLLSHEYYAGDEEKQNGLVRRLERYFTKQIKVAEKTIERLHGL